MKDWVANLLAISTIIGLVFVVLFVVSLSGGAVMKLFGFQYESVWSIVAYFGIVELLTLPVAWVSKAVPNVLWNFGFLPGQAAMLLYLLLDVGISYGSYRLVDNLMPSVQATNLAIFVLSVACAFVGFKDVLHRYSEETK